MRTRTLLVSSALVAALGLTGCAEQADPEPETTPTATAGDTGSATPSPSATQDEAQVVEITVEDGKVTPNGATVEVDADEPVLLEITADEAGELHIHTSPEQEVAYGQGTSSHEITLGRPGVYEVESHDLHLVVVKLQAS